MKILVIGKGLVGSRLMLHEGIAGVSHDKFRGEIQGYDLVVNCAAVAGQAKCDSTPYEMVIDANVQFPLRLYSACVEKGIPFVHLSTSGVYHKQVSQASNQGLKESAPVYPHNRYCASKLLGETVLMSNLKGTPCIILRMPWFVAAEGFKDRGWSYVQTTFTSVLYIADLYRVLQHCGELPSGIYNVKSKDVWFPDFYKLTVGGDLPARSFHKPDMTSSHPINDDKLKGLIDVSRQSVLHQSE